MLPAYCYKCKRRIQSLFLVGFVLNVMRICPMMRKKMLRNEYGNIAL